MIARKIPCDPTALKEIAFSTNVTTRSPVAGSTLTLDAVSGVRIIKDPNAMIPAAKPFRLKLLARQYAIEKTT